MERFFILGKYNTFADWHLILTAKDVTPPQPKTKYVELDGMDGTLDLSEALTGNITYNDRTIKASFWTDYGNRRDRSRLIRDIRLALHGHKMMIIEPDDPDHYFMGRIRITSETNIIPYAEIVIECICDPWRYSIRDSVRTVTATSKRSDVVLNNLGARILIPEIKVTGSVRLIHESITYMLDTGAYKLPDLRLYPGVNIVSVDGSGTISFTYKEADI